MGEMNTDRFKFRVWDNEDGRYRDDNDASSVVSNQGELFLSGSHPDCCGEWQWYCEPDPIEIGKKFIVEQCTGLRDKNGKLIFEGDILHDLIYPETRSSVAFEACKFGFKHGDGDFIPFGNGNLKKLLAQHEIVGNIHENPEMVK